MATTKIRGNTQIMPGTVSSDLFATLDTKIQYTAHPTFTADAEIVDKKYVDDKVVADKLSVIFQSPDGSRWRLSILDGGIIDVTLIP